MLVIKILAKCNDSLYERFNSSCGDDRPEKDAPAKKQ